MVPSVGLTTALYALSTPFLSASARSMTLAVFLSLRPSAIPAKSWDKMTPELPLAFISIPEAILDDVSPMELSFMSSKAPIPPSIVRLMFSPVSPSGIGNTFRSLTIWACSLRFAAPAVMNLMRSFPSSTLLAITIPLDFSLRTLLLCRLPRCLSHRVRWMPR